jgi:hypothetical protein
MLYNFISGLESVGYVEIGALGGLTGIWVACGGGVRMSIVVIRSRRAWPRWRPYMFYGLAGLLRVCVEKSGGHFLSLKRSSREERPRESQQGEDCGIPPFKKRRVGHPGCSRSTKGSQRRSFIPLLDADEGRTRRGSETSTSKAADRSVRPTCFMVWPRCGITSWVLVLILGIVVRR